MNVDKLTWYVSRSGGIVAWTLLALSLILGLLLSSRILGRKASPAWTLSVHRFLGGLSVLFTAVHVVAIMLDKFVSFGVADVLVPWASSWQPNAVAWGIVAMYLMVAVELTSFLMNRLPKKLWRGVHWMSAPLFGFATLHGYQAGSDAGRAFIVAILGVIVVLVALTAVRVVRSRRVREPRTDPRTLLAQAKNRPAMRAEPPVHVLDALTRSGPLPAAPATLAEALPPVPWVPPEPSSPGRHHDPTRPPARVRPSPASPDPWPESFFGVQPGRPMEKESLATASRRQRPAVTESEPPLYEPPTRAATQTPAPSPAPERRKEPLEPAMSGAPPADPTHEVEPPRPAWAQSED